jgi:hypothetical protein
MRPFVQHRKVFVAVCLLALTVCNLILAIQVLPLLRNGYQDFTIFYTGAELVRSGQSAALYDLPTQYRTQLTFAHVPIREGPLPFNHPPFEALLFIPFTMLGYWPAYIVWTVLNLLMLAATVILLTRKFPPARIGLFSIQCLAVAAFFPLAFAIIQGQDTILLLLLFSLTVLCLHRGRDAMAGAFLATGLYRPQLVLPIAALLAIRRWRILGGFVPVALVLGGLSVAVVGWWGSFDYVRFVLHLEGTAARAFGPQSVPNLRGLIVQCSGFATRLLQSLLILVSSIMVFLGALWRIRKAGDSILYISSLAVVTTLLVSFHALVYDLGLLLPLVLFMLGQNMSNGGKRLDWPSVILAFLLLFSPLYVFLQLVIDRFVWFSLILIWLYVRMILITPGDEAVTFA